MKKILSLMVVVAIAFAASAAVAKPEKGGSKGKGGSSGAMSVQVREAAVKTTPNYMAASVGTVSYGAQVNVVGEEGNWLKIDKPSGWLPKSVLTKHKVAANPDQKFSGKGTSHDEVALAGKGFNPQVEAKYKQGNASIAAAYVSVNKVEGFGANDSELKQFETSGKLSHR